MSSLRFKRIPGASHEVGLLIHPVYPEEVYLAVPVDEYPQKSIGLFIQEEAIETICDDNGLEYAAVRWTEAFDHRFVELIDLLVDLRSAHPLTNQLSFFDLEAAAA